MTHGCMFDHAFLEKQKKVLEEKRTRLETELAAFGKRDIQHRVPDAEFEVQYRDAGTDVGSDDENVHEQEDFQNRLSAAALLEKELRDVTVAIGKIEEGTYGLRADGTEIPMERLEAVPEATE